MNGLKKIFAPTVDVLVFIGAVTKALPELFHRRGRRWREFFYYFDLCGCQSLLIVVSLVCQVFLIERESKLVKK